MPLDGASVIDLELALPHAAPDVLALGAHLNNTVTVIAEGKAYVSKAVGDLDSPQAIADFEGTAQAMLAETGARPCRVAHDLHPDFASSRHAGAFGLPTLAVQHHHAHMAALAVEHGLVEPFLGIAFDGFGLGPGNEAWGGELLLVDGADYSRIGRLRPLPQPGGDMAAREPWRMAAAVLHELGRGGEIARRFAAHPAAPMLDRIMVKKLNAPPTSSCGRLFDAACGLLGLGQGPMELEALVRKPVSMGEGWTLKDSELNLLPLMACLGALSAEDGANLFHGTLAAAVLDWVRRASRETGVTTVALGGGCFFNKVLSGLLAEGLKAEGLMAHFPSMVSPGDPAISLGQAWIAALSEED